MSANHCSKCGHHPIHHKKDGTHYVCEVCLFLVENGYTDLVCMQKFTFKLSDREIKQAISASKDTYPQDTVCAHEECGYAWRQHKGMLCPSGNDTFIPLLDADLPYLKTK